MFFYLKDTDIKFTCSCCSFLMKASNRLVLVCRNLKTRLITHKALLKLLNLEKFTTGSTVAIGLISSTISVTTMLS